MIAFLYGRPNDILESPLTMWILGCASRICLEAPMKSRNPSGVVATLNTSGSMNRRLYAMPNSFARARMPSKFFMRFSTESGIPALSSSSAMMFQPLFSAAARNSF